MDQVAGHEAGHDAEGEIAPDPQPRRLRGALPHPERQHALNGHAHDEVEGEERPRLRREQGEGEHAQVIAVVGEEKAVEHEEAQDRAPEEDAERYDDPRPREKEDDGDEQEKRDESENGHLAHEGEEGVDPGNGGAERGVIPEIAEADESEQSGIDESEPASPAEQAPADGHYRAPDGRPAPSGVPRAPTPACSAAIRAISRAPISTLLPKLNVHVSRSAAHRSRNSGPPRNSSATYLGVSAMRSRGRMAPSSRRMRISIGSRPSSPYFGFRTRGGTSTKSTGLPKPRAYSMAMADQSLIRRSDSKRDALSSI